MFLPWNVPAVSPSDDQLAVLYSQDLEMNALMSTHGTKWLGVPARIPRER